MVENFSTNQLKGYLYLLIEKTVINDCKQ